MTQSTEWNDHSSAYIVLPHNHLLYSYRLEPGERSVEVGPIGNYGIGRAPDDTLPGPFPVVLGRHTSISGDHVAVLHYHPPGRVDIFDLATARRVEEIPIPDGVAPRCLALVGDRLFVGGGGAGMYRIGSQERQWIALQPPSVGPRFVEYLVVSAGCLWAIGDAEPAPITVRYDLQTPLEKPTAFELNGLAGYRVTDVAASRSHRAIRAVPVDSGNLGPGAVMVYAGVTNQRVAFDVADPKHRPHSPFWPTHIALAKDRVIGARQRRIARAGLTEGDHRLSWEPSGSTWVQRIIAFAHCEVTERLFAAGRDGGDDCVEVTLQPFGLQAIR